LKDLEFGGGGTTQKKNRKRADEGVKKLEWGGDHLWGVGQSRDHQGNWGIWWGGNRDSLREGLCPWRQQPVGRGGIVFRGKERFPDSKEEVKPTKRGNGAEKKKKKKKIPHLPWEVGVGWGGKKPRTPSLGQKKRPWAPCEPKSCGKRERHCSKKGPAAKRQLWPKAAPEKKEEDSYEKKTQRTLESEEGVA